MFALALVLDRSNDDDDGATTPASAASLQPGVRLAPAQPRPLRVAKSSKLKPKKTAIKKRGKRVFVLDASAPPLPSNPRTRRGSASPYPALPAVPPAVERPHLIEARLPSGPCDHVRAAPQLRPPVIRGPPRSVCA